jgi:hypothetical protein
MAQNRIQFQKGLSLRRFLVGYGTEEQCQHAIESTFRSPKSVIGAECRLNGSKNISEYSFEHRV